MKLHFYSLSLNGKIDYLVDATFKDNTYSFKDLSIDNTNISFKLINNHEIVLNRNGKINQVIHFVLGERTSSFYSGEYGLEFNFNIVTKKILIETKKISVEYDMFIDNEYQDTIKIYLLIK